MVKPSVSHEQEVGQSCPFSLACSPTQPFKAKWEYANLSVTMVDSLWTCLSVTEAGHVWRFQRFTAGPLFSHLLDCRSIWIINKDPSFNSDSPFRGLLSFRSFFFQRICHLFRTVGCWHTPGFSRLLHCCFTFVQHPVAVYHDFKVRFTFLDGSFQPQSSIHLKPWVRKGNFILTKHAWNERNGRPVSYQSGRPLNIGCHAGITFQESKHPVPHNLRLSTEYKQMYTFHKSTLSLNKQLYNIALLWCKTTAQNLIPNRARWLKMTAIPFEKKKMALSSTVHGSSVCLSRNSASLSKRVLRKTTLRCKEHLSSNKHLNGPLFVFWRVNIACNWSKCVVILRPRLSSITSWLA